MATQHLTTAQLQRMGLSHNEIRTRLSHGMLRRLRRGAYVLGSIDDPSTQHRLLMEATVASVHEGNVFSHVSAGVLHGLPVPREELGRATMIRLSSGHGDKGPHLTVRKTALAPDEIELRDGLRVTTLPRTVFDLARTQPFDWAVIVADAALRRGLAPDVLAATISRHSRLKGSVRAGRACHVASPLADSPLESVSRLRMLEAGLPIPQLQFEVIDGNGEFVARTDFGWPELGLLGEVDGKAKYGSLVPEGREVADVVMAEKRREERLRDLGYWVVRWGAAEAWNGTFVPRLRRAMARSL